MATREAISRYWTILWKHSRGRFNKELWVGEELLLGLMANLILIPGSRRHRRARREGEINICCSSFSSWKQQGQDIAVIVTAESGSKRILDNSVHGERVRFSIK
jgi:hypothetical protein